MSISFSTRQVAAKPIQTNLFMTMTHILMKDLDYICAVVLELYLRLLYINMIAKNKVVY